MVSIRIVGGWFYAMRRVLATVCVGLLAVLIGYKVIFGANGMKVWEGKRTEYQRLRQDIDDENAKHEQLQRKIDALQRADPSAIQKVAREQLGYVMPGDHVLYEPQAKAVAKSAPPPASPEASAQK
jgi:cell division protein FtsB